jgi:transposase-like protein
MNTTTTEAETTGSDVRGRLGRPARGERERVLSEWAASGRTVDETAAATGWSKHTLYRWRRDAAPQGRRRPQKVPKNAPLVAVPKPVAAASGNWAAEVTIGRIGLRLAASCSAEWAAQLIRELAPC